VSSSVVVLAVAVRAPAEQLVETRVDLGRQARRRVVLRLDEAQAEVYVDGGLRTGAHVLVALGLGARAVSCSGCSSSFATSSRAMQLAGCPDLESTRDGLVRRS
jgi:hypothetical protein